MKRCAFKTKKIDFVRGYRFRKVLRALLSVSLCVCTGSFLTSCATVPRETYLKNRSLSGVSKVAIVASVSTPEVSYSNAGEPTSLFIGGILSALPIVGLGFLILTPVAVSTEEAIRSGVDQGHAGKVREHLDLNHFEETLVQSFMQPLKKAGCFQTIEYMTDKNQEAQRLSSDSYDAIIRLSVREISLKKISGDNVRLNVYVRGQMESLSSGKVVWDREEHALSSETHSLDYYKENGLKELDAMLEKAGRILAYDFVYLK